MGVLTIQELHTKLVNKEITVREIVQEVSTRLAQAQHLNATMLEMLDAAQSLAASLDQMAVPQDNWLFGIPYGIKDNFCTKNIRTTACSKILSNYVPVYESTATELLANQHAIGICKTTMDELGMGGHGLYSYTGDVLNPWDHRRIIGGSSSGSAALVAAGVLPFALGTDTGDSVRKPAAYGGIVGFKPSYGLISRHGIIPYSPSLDTVGYFTHNIRDAAILLDALVARDHRDASSIASKEVHYNANLTTELGTLRVAYVRPVHDLINQEFRTIYDDLYTKLEDHKIFVESVEFPLELLKAIEPVYMIISYAEAISTHSNLDGINFGNRIPGEDYVEVMRKSRGAGFAATVKRRFVIGSFALARENQELLFLKAKRVRRLIVAHLEEIFAQYDVLLLPPTNALPPLVADIKSGQQTTNMETEFMENLLVLANFMGNPSLTMPIAIHNGFPLAININAKPFHEQTVLNFAAKLESLTGIKDLVAPMEGGSDHA